MVAHRSRPCRHSHTRVGATAGGEAQSLFSMNRCGLTVSQVHLYGAVTEPTFASCCTSAYDSPSDSACILTCFNANTAPDVLSTTCCTNQSSQACGWSTTAASSTETRWRTSVCCSASRPCNLTYQVSVWPRRLDLRGARRTVPRRHSEFLVSVLVLVTTHSIKGKNKGSHVLLLATDHGGL